MTFVTKIPVANSTKVVEANIVNCSFREVVLWQRRIHNPHIAGRDRIGANWHWPSIYWACSIAETALRRQALIFQIQVEAPSGQGVPVVQALISFPYAFPPNTNEDCVFLWFLASAPPRALETYGITDRFAVLGPVLDTIIHMSVTYGLGGRIGLHAAKGSTATQSEDLINKYLNCGLQRKSINKWYFRFQIGRAHV